MDLSAANGIHQAEISVAEIKNKAKEGINEEFRGVSAITLIKTARSQIVSAKDQEAKGDLQSAYGSYIRAVTLTRMSMDSPEYQQESNGKAGVVRKELNEFLANDGKDIGARTTSVEDKLKVIEKAHVFILSFPSENQLAVQQQIDLEA